MNYSPGVALGFYATDQFDNGLVVCRDCFSSDSSLTMEEPIYPPTADTCDFCGAAL